jgi:exopolysaccharide production protein ExoY
VLQESRSCESERLGCEVRTWTLSEFRADNVPFTARDPEQPLVGDLSPFGGVAKRCLDLAISFLLLPLVAFVGFPIACLVALNGGNPIYGHTRVGWNGRLFCCYKFRTMNAEAEHELQSILEQDEVARLQWLDRFKLENDPRVTPLGRWLRRTYLDEIPQVWNVLRGDMSWVGPRPIVPAEMRKYEAFPSAYLACRPGVSGLWQIKRRSDTTYMQRVDFDVQYARKWSAARDLMIMLLTIPRILFADSDG